MALSFLVYTPVPFCVKTLIIFLVAVHPSVMMLITALAVGYLLLFTTVWGSAVARWVP
jgi:hypothetical protein